MSARVDSVRMCLWKRSPGKRPYLRKRSATGCLAHIVHPVALAPAGLLPYSGTEGIDSLSAVPVQGQDDLLLQFIEEELHLGNRLIEHLEIVAEQFEPSLPRMHVVGVWRHTQ